MYIPIRKYLDISYKDLSFDFLKMAIFLSPLAVVARAYP
jgi:hypothetical protein